METRRIITAWFVLTLIGMIIMFAQFFNFYGLKEDVYMNVYKGFIIVYAVCSIVFARRLK